MKSLLGIVEVPLKPCPLCGAPAVMESVTTAMERVPRYRVRCTVCGVGCLHWDMWSVAESANWWNRRAENAWVSVKDRLPPLDTEVLVSAVNKHTGERQTVITYMKGSTYFGSKEIIFHKPEWHAPYQYFLTNNTITHWKNMPEEPEVGK